MQFVRQIEEHFL